MRDRVWREGEEAAWAVYRRRGYRLLARNWRTRLGELDLVVARGDLVVVCEVKARRGAAYGGPFEAVTPAKQRKLRALAGVFLAALDQAPSTVRFDVASVTAGRVHLYEDAF